MSTMDRYVSTSADIKVSRSRNHMTRKTKHSYFHGYLHPLGAPIEVLPGDTIKAKLSAFTRMSTPIVPFIDDIREEVDAFFVPKRIIWDYTKQFYGEAEEFGVATKVNEPRTTTLPVALPLLSTNLNKSETFAAAFGLIANSSSVNYIYLNANPIRAFLSIYNEYFRDENYQYQYKWNKSQSGDSNHVVATLGSAYVSGVSILPKVNKDRDLISSILPYQVKGNPITVALSGTVAPVMVDSNNFHKMVIHSTDSLKFGNDGVPFSSVDAENGLLGVYGQNGSVVLDDSKSVSLGITVDSSNLFADLSNAASIRVSDLLYSFAYQDFLARAAHFGTRMKEYIYSMFGCRIPDLSDDVPEYLGRLKFSINVQQVVQSTGFAPSSSTELGALGAYSNSGKYAELFTKSFTEPGYIVLVFYTKHERTYTTGVDRVFIKNELLDYYQPPFANIPDVPFGSMTIWLEQNSNESSLGFQEPWWDYRALVDRSYGMMNPMVDTLGQIWTLGEKWTAKPTIASSFMEEDRNAIARVLATGTNGPDYLCDFLLELDATRVMPLYSDGRLGRF